MFALYEDAGKFHAGRVLSAGDASVLVELASGKRVKVKAPAVLLRFEQPDPETLLAQATAAAGEIDLDLAWQFAEADEFAFVQLAADYFGVQAGSTQQAAMLLGLFGAPHYFRRLGKGRFRKAPEEQVKAALAGIEKKRQLALQVEAWADELVAGRAPAAVEQEIYRILFRPDKNAAAYKAVALAARRSGRPAIELLKAAGAIRSPYEFHWRRFLFERFPDGTAHAGAPAIDVEALARELPLAAVRAFSIDDSQTSEIDDALSVQGLGSGTVTVGIHIAAPALAVARDTALDRVARERLSTVYVPGHKLTMLPAAAIDAFTLREGRTVPALSLYATLDEATLACTARESRIERVAIAANLRHDVVGAEALQPEAPFGAELGLLWRWAQALKAERERVRGKPESFNRPDYAFRIAVGDDASIIGDEPVQIVPRERGSPLDLVVAEAMIFANASWGALLADVGLPGIYRSQASLAPGVKVRMGTRPAPHAGIGVACYAWSTSPLRRYVDLVNQGQLIAAVRHGTAAGLVAPFKPRDATLLAVVAEFESAYADYATVQATMERYWALRWLLQRETRELDAAVLKDGLVRADALPLVFRAVGSENLPRGTRLRVRIGAVDLLTLDLQASVLSRLDADAASATGAEAGAAGDDDEDASTLAGPIAVEVDVEAASAEPAATTEDAKSGHAGAAVSPA